MLKINLSFKFILRWVTILVISFMYYMLLAVSTMRFDIFRQNEALATNPVTIDQYHDSIETIVLSSHDTFIASIYTFPMALLLALLAFKKIR